MKKEKLTITDIARLTGFSKSTVSVAINGKPGISEENRKKILSFIAEIGYEPNDLARSLANNQSGSIAVIVSDITNPFFNTVVKAVEEIADQHNYTVLLGNTDFKHEREVKAVRTFLRKRVDGMIVTPLQVTVDIAHLSEIEQQGVPLAVLGQVNGLNAYSIEQNDLNGAYQAMAYLISKGHRKIAHLCGPSNSYSTHARLQAYKEILLKNEITINPAYIIEGGIGQQDGYSAGKRLVLMEDRPTALFCYNDLMAIGVAKAFNEAGLRIPDDLSLVGFDNIDFTPFPLTTVKIPIYEMGRQAAEYIIRRILKSEPLTPSLKIVQTELIERNSVADINP
jgi:LacI family transcriptional regulator